MGRITCVVFLTVLAGCATTQTVSETQFRNVAKQAIQERVARLQAEQQFREAEEERLATARELEELKAGQTASLATEEVVSVDLPFKIKPATAQPVEPTPAPIQPAPPLFQAKALPNGLLDDPYKGLPATAPAPDPRDAQLAALQRDLEALKAQIAEQQRQTRSSALSLASDKAKPPAIVPAMAMAPAPPAPATIPMCDAGTYRRNVQLDETQGLLDSPQKGQDDMGGYRFDKNSGYAVSVEINGHFVQVLVPYSDGYGRSHVKRLLTPVRFNGRTCLMPVIPPDQHTLQLTLDAPGQVQRIIARAWACRATGVCRPVGRIYVQERTVPDGFPAVTVLNQISFGL